MVMPVLRCGLPVSISFSFSLSLLLLLCTVSVFAGYQTEGTRCHVVAKSDGRQVFNLMGANMTRVVGATPPFSESDCWLMKARYTCRSANQPKDYIPPWEWKMSAAGKEPDFLENIVNKAGGVLEGLYSARTRCFAGVPSRDVPGGPNGPANIVFLGNSFIRQVYQTMACTYKRFVTGGRLQVQGPPQNISSLGATFDYSRFKLYDLPIHGEVTPECHGARENLDRFFEPQFKPNQTLEKCEDDHAMVSYTTEAGHQVNVYMFFRAHSARDLPETLQQLFGLKLEEIHGLVVNDGWGFYKDVGQPGERRKLFYKSFFKAHRDRGCRRTKPFIANFNHVRETSIALFKHYGSREALDKWPGAHNLGVKLDQSHACLPGVPYQEMLLLGLMYAKNIRLAENTFPHPLRKRTVPPEGCTFPLIDTL